MPLQKSFSEQNGSKNGQQRGQWQRAKTYNGPRLGRENDDIRKPEAPLPGLPTEASSATRRKLSSFAFGSVRKDAKPSESKAGSKSVPIDLDDEAPEEKLDTPVTKITSRLQQLSQDEPAKKNKGPGTPSGRLALPDLLSMADVDSPSRIIAKTPDDRVSWNHDPAAYSSSGFEYGETQGTKRRRAKSSSPMSSPARSTHFGVETPGLPVGQLSMNTPGLDLWANYGMNGAPGGSGLQNPLMAQLMSGTPPARDGSARRLAALTRSVSCGDQVPKKRRLGTEKSGYELFADVSKGSVTKHPRVGALLDGIKENTRKSIRSTDSGPSSSSPAGIRQQDDNEDYAMDDSPLAPRTMGPPAKATSAPEALKEMLPPVISKEPKVACPISSPGTDYGDDEYDDAMFHEASIQVYGTEETKIRQPSSSPSKRKNAVPAKQKVEAPTTRQQHSPPRPQAHQPRYVAPANRQQGLPQPHIQAPLQSIEPQLISKPAAKPISRQATLPAPKKMTPPPPPKAAAKPAFVWKEEEDEFAGVFSDLDDAEIIPDANAIEKKYNAPAATKDSNLTFARSATTAATVQRTPLAPKAGVKTENIPPGAAAPLAKQPYPSAPRPAVVAANPAHKPPVQAPAIAPADDDYDKFFDDDDDDFGIATKQVEEVQKAQQVQGSRSTATSGTSTYPPPSGSQKPRVIQRYLVTSIIEQQYQNARGREETEKVLQVQVDKGKETYTIHLRGSWVETPVTEKAYVHIIGDFVSGSIIVDDLHNMIILHPDHLLSSTVVADSFSCTRRAVLQDRVKATSEMSGPLVYGTILHEIFQESMMVNRWDTPWLHDLIDRTCKANLEKLYTIKVQIPQAVEHLRSKMNELQAWANVFVSETPRAEAKVSAGNGETAIMAITKLLDVEEHVWSPMYGLKGNIDATVQVTMQDIKTKKQRVLTVPFEVKTGKSVNASHRAQTALYNLLLSDRYDIEIVYGILYYMESSETVRIPRIRHELRHMIMQRNALAVYVRDKSTQLPPMLKKEPLCNRCYAKTTCFIYHKLAEDGDGETSGMKGKFDELVKHLTPRHKEFFMKWDDLLTKEERESMKFRRELWTMLSKEREKLGRCFSTVVIEPGSAYEEVDAAGGKINRFRYTLIRDGDVSNGSFLESQIAVGEPIVISDEKGHFALANGYVTHIRKHRATVAVDRRLHNARIRKNGFDEEDNQVFASIMDVRTRPGNPKGSAEPEAVVRYRLDKDEFSNGMATVRNNLIQIMTDSAFGALKIRSLIVDLVAPKFKGHGSTQYEIKDRAELNIDQRRAIEKVMSAEDYALVLGMPGTGKTTTIAHIIRALVGQGKSVLLTSYTHSAVDTILLKLKDACIPILRLGAPAKIHPEVQIFARLASKPQESFEAIHALWHDSPIVATTCLGTSHALFSERTFDYCIVDEASQITLPVCIGPIRLAKTFVLVGDHNQLPPLVQNEDARKGGLDISLFKLLSDAAPDAVCVLSHQYRMCADVMELSNNLIYGGRLKCGTRAVAERRLHVPHPAGLMACHVPPILVGDGKGKGTMCAGPYKGCWLANLLDPATTACFLNTDTHLPLSLESSSGNRIVNSLEAAVVTQLVSGLLAIGIPGAEIGVMTHYRSQLALLKHGMRNLDKQVEMHTCDRFQGRDKEVVIISLVRSNEQGSIGELLKDWRRINVAFTRARTKLIVVGSGRTLKGVGGGEEGEAMVGRFVALMEERGWVYDLPGGALESHAWGDGVGTQVSTLAERSPEVGIGRWKSVDRKENVKPEWAMGGAGEKLTEGQRAKREPRRQGAGERVLLDGRPVLRDILNEALDS